MRNGPWDLFAVLLGSILAVAARAEEAPPAHAHGVHEMDAGGMVMNQNTDQLPRDCPKISGDVKITVHAGKRYAEKLRGTMYAYDQGVWNVPACARVTVTLVNDDHIRHQWMLHGLPRYLYPEGMFHLEVSGPGEKSGTFIVPSVKKTYLVHCDVPQHAEKGMKAELKVAGGDGDLPSIPGISSPAVPERYAVQWDASTLAIAIAGGLAGLTLALTTLRPTRRSGRNRL